MVKLNQTLIQKKIIKSLPKINIKFIIKHIFANYCNQFGLIKLVSLAHLTYMSQILIYFKFNQTHLTHWA